MGLLCKLNIPLNLVIQNSSNRQIIEFWILAYNIQQTVLNTDNWQILAIKQLWTDRSARMYV